MEPTVIRSAKEGVALSFIVPTDVSAFFGEALRYELLDQLSHGRGLIYSIDIITTLLDAGRCQLDLVLDPVESNVRVTFIEAVTAVRNLAEIGFGANAMLNARRSLEAELAWDDNSAAFAYLGQLALDRLLGRPTSSPTELLDRAAVISPEELNEVLRSALGNLVVAVDRDAGVKRKDAKALGMVLDPYEIWQPGAHIRDEEAFQETMDGHRVWRHKSSKALVWLTSTHLWRRRGGKTKSIELAGVVLVGERDCGCIALVDGRGRSDELPTEEWKQGRTLRSALLLAFPVGTVRRFPEK